MFGQEESGRAAGGRQGRQGRLFMAAGCSYIMSGRRQGERERGGEGRERGERRGRVREGREGREGREEREGRTGRGERGERRERGGREGREGSVRRRPV